MKFFWAGPLIKSLKQIEPFIVVSYVIHIKPKYWSSYNSETFLEIFLRNLQIFNKKNVMVEKKANLGRLHFFMLECQNFVYGGNRPWEKIFEFEASVNR